MHIKICICINFGEKKQHFTSYQVQMLLLFNLLNFERIAVLRVLPAISHPPLFFSLISLFFSF